MTKEISRKDYLKTTLLGFLSIVLIGKLGIEADGATVTDNLRPSGGGSHVGPNPPTKTSMLWIDTANDGITKYYDGTKWVATRSTWYE